jgi:type II secretory pathway pseudopilin PulG
VRIRNLQSGYALLTMIFLAAVMLIAAAVAVPRVMQQGRRERELETIWRGKQYARAVKLFYRKNGRFPHSMDELTKPVNNVRFLRQPYKDPFNREDGSWRLIYVGPMGQLIGSVKPALPGQGGPAIQLPGAPGAPSTVPGGAQPPGQLLPQPGQPPVGTPTTPTQPMTPIVPSSGLGGPVIGGNIIGVGSKVNQPSIIVYDGGATYREWEFIWNPAKDPITVGGAPTGTTGVGPQPGTPLQPPPPPPATTPASELTPAENLCFSERVLVCGSVARGFEQLRTSSASGSA